MLLLLKLPPRPPPPSEAKTDGAARGCDEECCSCSEGLVRLVPAPAAVAVRFDALPPRGVPGAAGTGRGAVEPPFPRGARSHDSGGHRRSQLAPPALAAPPPPNSPSALAAASALAALATAPTTAVATAAATTSATGAAAPATKPGAPPPRESRSFASLLPGVAAATAAPT